MSVREPRRKLVHGVFNGVPEGLRMTKAERIEKVCFTRVPDPGGAKALAFYAAIFAERARQIEKWGIQSHSAIYWLGILGEEYGEACKALIEGDASTARKELVHLAAVAEAMWEVLERLE